MSYVLNTSVTPFCHSQNYPGSVSVPACGVSARFAQEGSFAEFEWLLGSRETLGTRPGCVGGRDQHHLSASPLGTGDQLSLGCANGSVSGLPGHGGLGQKGRLEVLHRDQVVMVGYPLGPHPAIVLCLAGGFLVQLGRFPTGPFVPVGLLTPLTVTAGHLALRFSQFGSTPLSVSPVGQVVLVVGGCGCSGHSPVDTDASIHFRGLFLVATGHERGVPVPQAVLIDTHTRGRGGKFSRPHHRNRHTLSLDSPM